jgi:hypothetical protein
MQKKKIDDEKLNGTRIYFYSSLLTHHIFHDSLLQA